MTPVLPRRPRRRAPVLFALEPRPAAAGMAVAFLPALGAARVGMPTAERHAERAEARVYSQAATRGESRPPARR